MGDLTNDGSTPVSEIDDQALLQMYDSQNAAKVAALRALHWSVRGANVGVTVTGVVTNAPTWGVLDVADRILKARGHAVTSGCGLVDAMAGAVGGQPVALEVERARFTSNGEISGYSKPEKQSSRRPLRRRRNLQGQAVRATRTKPQSSGSALSPRSRGAFPST